MKKLIPILTLILALPLQAQRISDLPAASSASDSDLSVIVQGGTTKKAAVSLLRAILASQVTDSTVVGRNLLRLTSPGAVTYLRINADNTVTALSAADFRTALAFGISDVSGLQTALDGKQPLDSDLTIIAGLTTEPYGRGFLGMASKNESLMYLGIPFDDVPQTGWEDGNMPVWNLADTFFTKAPSTSYGRGLLNTADAEAARNAIGLGTTNGAMFAWLNAGGINLEENVIIIPEGGNITLDGNTYTGLFDGSAGHVALADAPYNAADFGGIDLSNISGNFSTLFDGTGGHVAYAERVGSASSSLGYADIAGLFDGTGGAVAYANYIQTPTTPLSGSDLNSLFDGSGGYVNRSLGDYYGNDLSGLFDGTGGNVYSAVGAQSGWDGSYYTAFAASAFAGVPFYSSGNYSGDGLIAAGANTANVMPGGSLYFGWNPGTGSYSTNGDPLDASTITTTNTPPASNAAGTAGQMVFTDTYTYRCFGTGDWRRTPVTYTGGY